MGTATPAASSRSRLRQFCKERRHIHISRVDKKIHSNIPKPGKQLLEPSMGVYRIGTGQNLLPKLLLPVGDTVDWRMNVDDAI
ncbi:hypothetical protein [Aminobacter sp. MDW-2]|uniref:hypothetical protein n=1 Tax=Aminobacter sp. MDW-2 TaxID=2666139 RepID=UPI0012B10115|nr:hypothetical protein [Aminobacter sp. MDW-2]MRX37241.1 hypothetical protein [Aminobacter sp. MDW-2]QNH33251.1 hypothetical protein H5P29_22470 [Aminobacter sp. MDW-2]